MAINLGLGTQLDALKEAPKTGIGFVNTLLALVKAAMGKFGDTAEKNIAPGPDRVVAVGDDGKIPSESLGGLGVNSDLAWEFRQEGTGTRLSTISSFDIVVEGNKRKGIVVMQMLPAPGSGGSGVGDGGNEDASP